MKLVKISSDRIQIQTDLAEFKSIRINDLLSVSDKTVILIAMVTEITDTDTDSGLEECDFIRELSSMKTIECAIIGSLKDSLFVKSITRYPVTDVKIREVDSTGFQSMLGKYEADGFKIGKYTEYDSPAFVDGNKFFQRHACILGNTGSGKSETVAKILQEASRLPNTNIIVFDIHGEYSGLSYVRNLKVGDESFPFPIWMFSFSDIVTNILKIKGESSTVTITALRKCFYRQNPEASENQPCYFDYYAFINDLECLNQEEIPTGDYYKTGDKAGAPKTTKGDYNGKLTNVINALKDRKADSRYQFLFDSQEPSYLQEAMEQLLDNGKPVKNIDLSDLPHDVAIMVIGTITRLVYDFQRRQKGATPIVLICDEAHVYIPNNYQLSASEQRMAEIFEDIAKEGRKFGTTLLAASQRPSELNKTVVAQCANFVVSKLNNENDKSMIKAMLPDGNDKLIDAVTMFNPGEVLIVGDAVPIPLKIQVSLAEERPESRTINFWDIWSREPSPDIRDLVTEYLK